MQALSDQQLIDKAAQGNQAAFETLYTRYRDWVYQLAWRFCQDQDLAQDVLQECFSYLIKKLPSLKLTAKLTTFLYPAVRNLSLNALRAQRRYAGPAEDLLEELPAPPPPDDSTEDLAILLKDLPTAQRQILLMRYVDDMTVTEIATALDIPEGTVKSRLHHALAHLRSNPQCRHYFFE